MVMFFAPVMERAPTVEPKVIAALLLPLALIARLLLSRMFVSTVNTDMAFWPFEMPTLLAPLSKVS